MTIRSIFGVALALALIACGKGAAGGSGNSSAGGSGTAGGSGSSRAGGSGSTAGGSGGTAGGTGATAGGSGNAGGSSSGSAGGDGMTAGGTGTGAAGGTGVVTGGDTCAAPTVLTASGTYTSTTMGLADDYRLDVNDAVAPCYGVGTPGAGDAVFQFDVTAGNRASFKVESAYDLVVNLIAAPAAACGAVQPDGTFAGMVCAGGSDLGLLGEPETVLASTPGTYFAIVDGYDATDVGPITVTFANGPIPVGDLCTAPTVISMSGTMANQTMTGFGNDYDLDPAGTGCTGFEAPGLDRVYEVTVPNGMTLTGTATPVGAGAMDDLSIYFVDSPAASCTATITACLAGKDDGVEAEPETATFTNTSGATKQVFVIVDSFDPAGPNAFDMVIQVQ